MLIVFGSIAMTLTMGVDTLPDINERLVASSFAVGAGGKGANQALAAARAGAGKVAIIGKISDDEFSSHILTKIRRDGVMTSGVGQSDLPTATHVIAQDSRGRTMEIVNPGANVETSHTQVPDDILNDKALVLVQTDLAEAENDELLARAKVGGTKTVMNLSPSIKMSKRMLKNIDYLIANHEEARKLATQMDLQMDMSALKMAEGLAQLGGLYCIITLGSRGAVAVTPDRVGWEVEALDVEDIIDRAGAEDAYCGTFAACIYNRMPFPTALKWASVAGSLACTKAGVQESFPYLSDIEERINGLADPKQIKL